MVAGALAADAHVFALCLAGGNGTAQQRQHGGVALVKVGCEQLHAAVAIQAERELRQVVGADAEAIEVFEELLGQNGVARDFAHHDVAQAVFAALEAARRQQGVDLFGLLERAHEGDHDFHIGQAHFIAHALDGFALHGKGFGKVFADVTRRAAKTQHGVFFFRLVAAAADELAVFVALEVAHAHDHGLGPECRSNGGHAFGHFIDVKRARAGMAAGHAFYRLFQVRVDLRIVQNRLGVHTDVVVDDELQARQAHPVVGELAEIESQLRVAHVHHDLGGDFGHGAALHLGDFGFKHAVVNAAGIAFGAAHGYQCAAAEFVGGIATTHHGRNAQLARDDGRVAGAPAPVGDDGAGALHHRFPVGVCHVGHEHIARLHGVHLAHVRDQTHRAGADFLANGTAFGQHGALAFELVAVFHLALSLALHCFGPCLQDVELAVGAVFAPLDVHGAAVVFFDHQGVTRELLHLVIGE